MTPRWILRVSDAPPCGRSVGRATGSNHPRPESRAKDSDLRVVVASDRGLSIHKVVSLDCTRKPSKNIRTLGCRVNNSTLTMRAPHVDNSAVVMILTSQALECNGKLGVAQELCQIRVLGSC